MRGHTNYRRLIETLVLFKDKIRSNSPLAEYLKGVEYSTLDYDAELPILWHDWILRCLVKYYSSFSPTLLEAKSLVTSSSLLLVNGYASIIPAARKQMVAGSQLINILMPGTAPLIASAS